MPTNKKILQGSLKRKKLLTKGNRLQAQNIPCFSGSDDKPQQKEQLLDTGQAYVLEQLMVLTAMIWEKTKEDG